VQERGHRNAGDQGIHAPAIRRIPEPETSEPLRASESWRALTMHRKIAVVLALLALMLSSAGGLTPAAAAQEQVVRVDGLVQWIGGQQMIVQADTGPSVGVDLTSVPQDEYAGLGVRDRVAVIGMVSPDGRKVIGTAIMRSERAR
jgi:hypothetical protein